MNSVGRGGDGHAIAAIRRYNDQAWTKPIQMLAPGSCTSPNPAPCHGFLPDSGPAPTGYRPAALRAQEHQPVYVYEVLHPLSVVETFPGSHVYIFDMGNDRRRYRGKSLESGPWDPHHRLLLRG